MCWRERGNWEQEGVLFQVVSLLGHDKLRSPFKHFRSPEIFGEKFTAACLKVLRGNALIFHLPIGRVDPKFKQSPCG